MGRISKWTLGLLAIALAGGIAFADRSEYVDKMQEDLDYYKKQLIEKCGVAPHISLKWIGRLEHNPRETNKGEHNAPSTLCTSGLEGLNYACQTDRGVKAAISKVDSIVCMRGKGTLGFGLRAPGLTFTVDSQLKVAAANQRDAFIERIKDEVNR